MMNRPVAAMAFGVLLLATLSGCSDTRLISEYKGTLARPEQVVVYDLKVAADEVRLDDSPSKVAARAQTSRTAAEIRTGRAVADATSAALVAELQAMGMPAVRASEVRAGAKNVLAVRGHFISIDEGNRFERVTIGLGAGRSAVTARVKVYANKNGTQIVAEEFEADAKSLLTPGMAETMGAGAIAGHLGAAAVVSGSSQIVSEAFVQNVKADGKQMAKALAGKMKDFFLQQGWIYR